MSEYGEHFIREIEIKNYKLFKDFKAEGFGRVNLIGGKNNVGKTAFMEACWINSYSKSIEALTFVLYSIFITRNYIEYVDGDMPKEKEVLEKYNNITINSNYNKIKFNVKKTNGIKEYEVNINHIHNIVNINKFSFDMDDSISNIEFIDNVGFTSDNLKDVFEAVQKHDKENTLYKYINEFDKNILNFKIIGGDKPQCKVTDGEYRDINEFGDGLKHWISIICSLYACKDGYLFIDEIDNGLHYTMHDKLWEIILKISKEQNVQVFATTHSKECIESFARVAKRLEDDEIGFIELGRNKEDKIRAIVMDSQRFFRELEVNNEVRGW